MSVGATTLPVLQAPLPPGVTGVFTTRQGGVSRAPWEALNLATHVGDDPQAVTQNRARLAALLDADALVVANQVHGADVAIVDGTSAPAGSADAMVTTRPGVALMVQVADCLPVLFADAAHGVVAVAHAGRPGLVAGVLQATVAAMASAGAVAADVVAVIGPGACGACYEVPAEMRADVAQAVPGSAASTRRGTPSVDLAVGAVAVLERLGLGQIRRVDGCTIEDPRFYSYRRDGVTGRFGGVIMLAAPRD